MATKALMSAVEFSAVDFDETEQYELVEGELVPLASPTPWHARVRHLLERLLGNYFDQNPHGLVMGEMDSRLSEGTVRRPDISVLLAEKSKSFDWTKSPLPFAPDIAIEVLSPSEPVTSVHRKALEYLSAGSQEIWQLDYENGEIFIQTDSGIRLLRGDQILESPLLPGFSVSVKALLVKP